MLGNTNTRRADGMDLDQKLPKSCRRLAGCSWESGWDNQGR